MAKQLRQKAKSTQSTKQNKSNVLAKNKATDEQVQPSAMKASPVKGKKRVSFGAVTDDDQKNSIDQQVNVPISKGNDIHKPSVSESSTSFSQPLANKNTNYKKSITNKAKANMTNNKKQQTNTNDTKNKDDDDTNSVESLVDNSEDDYDNNQQNEEKEEEDSDNESNEEDNREEELEDDDDEKDNLSDLMMSDEEDEDDDDEEVEEEEEDSSNPFVQSKKHHTPLSYPVLCLRFLPPEFQEPQLYKFLNQFGANVLNCFCVRSKRTHQSKGIAYVQMDQAEILPTLVEECHGMMLGNRAVQARIVNLHRAMPTKEKVTRRRNLAYAYKTRGAPMKKHNVLYKSPVALLIKAARNEQANNAHLQRLGIDYQTDFFTSQLMQIPPECITRKVKGLKLPSATKSHKSDNITTVEQVSSNHVKDAHLENVVKAAKGKHNHTHKNKKTNVKTKVHITKAGQNNTNNTNRKQTPVHAKRTTSSRRAPRKAIKKTK